MTGYELRLWRKGMAWEQERAAEELGISRRMYQYYEKNGPTKTVTLATRTLTLLQLWKELPHDEPVKALRGLSALIYQE
ncbi:MULTISPECIES: hypothetical protein [Yersinia]|uniref:HTH cro/C1-type domain-containing protein n=1 Tax=Yersinia enterocolitica LC20 TaxID=1443113 RepID=A0A7U4K374_YEREN|nr:MULTISPECIES: hypothetical protein [Yersinia]OVZ83555.1 hypothetical protein CBW54_15840 [Yersinia kristensenii]AHM76591.1 hypothetical protein LC20_06019 [Yersinia hibernica]MBW5840061.1 hypothetical protein [Yersinia enterocolitica]MBW5848675.1 hypothetical protein [Yersinia enterocolitica]MBW5857413.1 hypothetical protein [Yersinia enterocolitica]